MGIRFSCPNGHKLNVKDHLAGKRGVCPACGAKFVIPAAGQSTPTADQLPTGEAAVSAPGDISHQADASASASIVIAVADAPPTSGPAVAPVAPAGPIMKKSPPQAPQIAAPAPMSTPSAQAPVAASEFEPPPAAVSKYTAHRMRSRRLQTTIAIGLLIAVVVLGVVMIWVLLSGNDTTSSSQSANRVRDPSQVVRQNE
jgi:hypothetical protein